MASRTGDALGVAKFRVGRAFTGAWVVLGTEGAIEASKVLGAACNLVTDTVPSVHVSGLAGECIPSLATEGDLIEFVT